MVAQRLGHFDIIEQIGAGGMGRVYRARDRRLERDVAIKVLPPGTLADPAAAKRFIKEAHALSSLNHPNIAAIYHFDTQGDVEFMVMELVTGTTLAHKLHYGPLKEKEAIGITMQLAEALREAHQKGIIHSDLKPQNIMVNQRGQVKVLDFGIARILTGAKELGTTLTADYIAPAGTLPYMPPEQLLGRGVDARSDIYASGVVLYELITALRPFTETNPTQLMTAILRGNPPKPRSLNPAISRGLERIILKALQRDPAQRQQSADNLLEELQALAAGDAVRRPTSHSTSGTHRWSMAVLPLINMDKDPETEYLSDGVTETLINDLSQLPNFRVMARTTVFRFKNAKVDPRQIGKRLGVRAVVTGKISQHAGHLNTQIELVNVSDGSQLWGQRYTRRITDLILVQEEMAQEISRHLQFRLTRNERKALVRYHPTDPDAYQLYLKGRYYAQRWTTESVHTALQLFHDAIRRDPNYAQAYAAIAEAYYGVSSQFVAPSEAMPKVKQAALKALDLDYTLAEAHVLSGVVKAFYEYDPLAAEAEFRRGLELNDRSASVRQWYAYYLAAMSRHQEAAAQLQAGRQIDPLSGSLNVVMGIALMMARNFEGAVEQLSGTIDLDSELWMAHVWRGVGEARLGRVSEAVEDLQIAIRRADSTYAWGYLAGLYAVEGNREQAKSIVSRLEDEARRRYVSPHHIALGYLALDRDRAFQWLETAYQNREEIFLFLNVDPSWDEIRSDPRFDQLLRRVALSG